MGTRETSFHQYGAGSVNMHALLHGVACGSPPPRPFATILNRTQATLRDAAILGQLDDPGKEQWQGRWAAYIIAMSNQSDTFAQTAAMARELGLDVFHVPASRPEDFISREDQVAAAFGCARVRATGGSLRETSPRAVAVALSHERGLRMLAMGRHEWGILLEEDVMLHPDITASQAAQIIRRAAAAAGAISDREIGLYIGSCNGECTHATSSLGGLPSSLLRGGRCFTYCSHAYAVRRRHARTFYHNVMCAIDNAQGQPCGSFCRTHTCMYDANIRRFFKFTSSVGEQRPADREKAPWVRTDMWLVGDGLEATESGRGWGIGLILQNRSWSTTQTSMKTKEAYRFPWPSCNRSAAFVNLCDAGGGLEPARVNGSVVVNDGPRCSYKRTRDGMEASQSCEMSHKAHELKRGPHEECITT